MDKNIKIGLIGLGCRGTSLYKHAVCHYQNVQVTAVCDVRIERAERVRDLVMEKDPTAVPLVTADYREVLASDVDCVLIATDWAYHAEIACAAMESGKAVACEVGGLNEVDEAYRLVETYERTQTPLFFMENCCFDKTETTVTNMVRGGLFGEIVYCSGAYGHDLREEVAMGTKNGHYRQNEYKSHNSENYPTHELGPIAMLLGVNRGNRMVSLSSTASKAAGLKDYVARGKKHDDGALGDFNQADVVVTNITCENGALITLKLDTTLPRSYHREFHVAGTRGRYTALCDEVFLDGDDEWVKSKSLGDYPEYLNPEWSKENEAKIKERGHGGMDYIMLGVFFECLASGKPMPIDVYDMAAWAAVTTLSAQSIREGKAVAIPDFTKGKYKERK